MDWRPNSKENSPKWLSHLWKNRAVVWAFSAEQCGRQFIHTSSASKEWFNKFKKWRSGRAGGRECVGGPWGGAEVSFLASYSKLIEKKGYKLEQLFDADEAGIFWKMPSRTFPSKKERSAPGFKVVKIRFFLLFCSNASESCMVKPLLLYCALNPSALKGKNKHTYLCLSGWTEWPGSLQSSS